MIVTWMNVKVKDKYDKTRRYNNERKHTTSKVLIIEQRGQRSLVSFSLSFN